MKKKAISKNTLKNALTYAMVILAFIICKTLIDNGQMSRSLKGQMIPICVYIIMAVSLNLTVGISGELSLGHAGFMSVGAFTGVVISTWMLSGLQIENTLVRLVVAMMAGGITAGIAGVLIGIPVLRLRGDYLAIVTLAFGEIIRNVINCLYIAIGPDSQGTMNRIYILFNKTAPAEWLTVVNGPAGAVGIAKISTFPVAFILVMFTLIVVLNLINSRSGRAIMAIRDSRIAAESVGINITKYKMMAFVTSAVLAGMAGALYGLNYSTISASKFKFDTSILILVFVVLGGIGNIRGSIIAAALLTILPELLRSFADYRMLVYAIVLIIVMLATNTPFSKTMIEKVKTSVGKAFKLKGGEKA